MLGLFLMVFKFKNDSWLLFELYVSVYIVRASSFLDIFAINVKYPWIYDGFSQVFKAYFTKQEILFILWVSITLLLH